MVQEDVFRTPYSKVAGTIDRRQNLSRRELIKEYIEPSRPVILADAADKWPGVGKVTEKRLEQLGIKTVGDMRNLELQILEDHFGRYGLRLHELAQGIDHSAVIPDRPTKSISAEDTFETDVPLAETESIILRLAEKVWAASRKETRIPRTVVLKLKTSQFNILTRSHTPVAPPASCEELVAIALTLRERVNLDPQQRFRLVGVGLSNFRESEEMPAQPALFE